MWTVKVDFIKLEKVEFENYTHLAMQMVEPDIFYKAAMSNIRGMDSDDIAQELRLHIWKKIHRGRYDPRKAGFRAWAKRVIANKIKDLHRKTQRVGRDALDDDKTINIDTISI